jgi:REP element-mobilizing transposase RayT
MDRQIAKGDVDAIQPPTRSSLRLPGYDYRSQGAYFVTVITAKRACVLGEVVDDSAHPNEIGRIVARTWREIPDHFPHVHLDEFVVMPNHLHGILVLGEAVGAKHASPLQPGRPRGTSRGSVSAVVQAFKSSSARLVKRVSSTTPEGPFWQRGFYDRIIRDQGELERLRDYIVTNPLRWALDRENPAVTAL